MAEEQNHHIRNEGGIPCSQFLVESLLFAKLYKASWNQLPDKELAVKRIDFTTVTYDYRTRASMKNLRVLIKLNHPNIVKAYQLVKAKKYALIFMYYLKNYCIQDLMRKRDKPFEENEAKLLFKDMMNAINYIRSEGIAHRGLSPTSLFSIPITK